MLLTETTQSDMSETIPRTKKTLDLRVLRSLDIDTLSRLATLFADMHTESAYAQHKLDHKKVFNILDRVANTDDHWGLIAWLGEKPIGIIGAYASPHKYVEGVVTCDHIVYISAEYRTEYPTLGVHLINKYIEWAQEVPDIIEINIATTFGHKTEKVERLYNYLGFTKSGAYYSRRV